MGKNELRYFIFGRAMGESYTDGPLTEEELQRRIADHTLNPEKQTPLRELGYDTNGFTIVEGREVSLEPVEIVKTWKVKDA